MKKYLEHHASYLRFLSQKTVDVDEIVPEVMHELATSGIPYPQTTEMEQAVRQGILDARSGEMEIIPDSILNIESAPIDPICIACRFCFDKRV